MNSNSIQNALRSAGLSSYISSAYSDSTNRNQNRQLAWNSRNWGNNQNFLKLLQNLIKQLQGYHFSHDYKKKTKSSYRSYRSYDGSNNNSRYPEFGKASTPFRQFLPKDSGREIGGATEANLPSARAVSNAVAAQTENTQNSKGLSDMFWLWGQFLDHDINHTPVNQADVANISVPVGDRFFDPNSTGAATIGFSRSDTITDKYGRERQYNAITAFIDGSNVYGSSEEHANELRTFTGGRLIESENSLLPYDNNGNYIAGDERANEHAGLTAMHTLWMREHNRVADQLAEKHPRWNDERLFQEARQQVVAQMQAITYNEFLPQLLGEDALKDYRGYNKRLDPQISNAFATAAFRLGHTMLSPTLLRLDEEGNEVAAGHLSLRDAFFKPENIHNEGIDSILRGFAAQTAQAVDPMLIDDVRNFLFGPPGAGGFDLAALNTQRGRDHGLPSLNDAREALGLSRISSFDDPAWQGGFGQKLAQVYDSPDEVDLWIGGLAEKQQGDSLVGATFSKILTDQFHRLRAGDSFWYEKTFRRSQIKAFNNTTLADVIKRNTDIQTIQDNVLVAQPRISPAPAIRTMSAQGFSAPASAAPGDTVEADTKLEADQQQRIRNAIASGLFG